MGVLELIKIRRILICKSVFDPSPLPPAEEIEDLDQSLADRSDATAGLTITFTLNPDFDPEESDFVSEFESDAPEAMTEDEEKQEESSPNGNQGNGN